MKQYTNTKKPTTLQSVANAPIQRKSRENSYHLIDNRPQTTIQRKLQQSHTLPIQFVKDGIPEVPKVKGIYDTAKMVFGSYGSPQIADMYKNMEQRKDPILSKPASLFSGWHAGKHETAELAKYPKSDDYRDKIAKSKPATFMRPFAAAITGGMLKSGYQHQKMMMNPDSYNPSLDPFNPLF